MNTKKYIPSLKNSKTKNSINYLTQKKNLIIDASYQKKNNPLNFVKFPEEIYKNANLKKELHLLLTWYQAKSLSIHGSFKTQNDLAYSIKFINKEIKKQSISTIKKHLHELEKKGLIFKQNNHLILCKYDILFQYFNIDLENPKILKIKIEELYSGEYFNKLIKRNLKKQEQKVKEHYFKKCCTSLKNDFEDKGRKMLKKQTNRFLNNNLEKLIKFQFKNQIARKVGWLYDQKFESKTKNLFFDISLTQNKISNIFGFKSPANGFKIIKNLENKGLIFCKKRFLCLKNIDYQHFIYLTKSRSIPISSFYKNGDIFIRISNKIFYSKEESNLSEIIYLYSNSILNFNLNMGNEQG